MSSRSSWVVRVTAVIFLCTSFIFRFIAFIQTSYANGWDGYFYINQVRSLMEEGKMDVPDVSLVYPLMMLIQLVARDYVLSYKILACLLAGMFTMSLFLLSLKWSDNYKTALVLGCLSLFSPHLTYFAAQYPKNLLGVILFTWLLYAMDAKRKIIPVLLLIIGFFGHRVTAVLGFGFLLANAFLKRAAGMVPYVLALFVMLMAVGGIFLPGLLNFFDVERFQGILSGDPQFAPYSFVNSFGTELISYWWFIEITGCCLVFFVAMVSVIQGVIRGNYDTRFTIVLLVLSFLIFPFFDWSADGPAFRFFVIFILLCPLLLIFLLKPMHRTYMTYGACAVLITCSFFSFKSYDPSKHDPPYRVYDIVGEKVLSNLQADSVELIIAHKSLAEYIVYSTGIDAMSWIPEYEIEPSRLWRISEGVKDVQFDFYLDADDLAFVHWLTPSYSLVREDRWKKFIRHVEQDNNGELLEELRTWKNPDRVRPLFMKKKKGF